MKTYLSEQDYNFIYTKVPRVCVDLFVMSGRRIVFTKRSIEPYKDHWHLPGGRVRFREPINNAIRRIGNDELGIDFDVDAIGHLIGSCEFLSEVQEGNERHTVSLIYLINMTGKELNLKDGLLWEEIPNPFIPEQKEFLLGHGLI